jgi:hypothetical protein
VHYQHNGKAYESCNVIFDKGNGLPSEHVTVEIKPTNYLANSKEEKDSDNDSDNDKDNTPAQDPLPQESTPLEKSTCQST